MQSVSTDQYELMAVRIDQLECEKERLDYERRLAQHRLHSSQLPDVEEPPLQPPTKLVGAEDGPTGVGDATNATSGDNVRSSSRSDKSGSSGQPPCEEPEGGRSATQRSLVTGSLDC